MKDVLFLCNFRFSLSLSWVSSSALELCSLFPSLMASFIPSLPYSLKEAASEKSEKKKIQTVKILVLKTQFVRFIMENYATL